MAPLEEEDAICKTLIGYEGIMLPSKTELNFAKKGKFDLYTLTNLSFMDLAMHINITPNLYAVTRANLADREEQVVAFADPELFSASHGAKVTSSPPEKETEHEEQPKAASDLIKYDAVFELKHGRDEIYEVSAKLQDIVGIVNDLVILELPAFEILVTDLSG